ncbi:Ig-like domain-containing protein [Flavobacterium alkalisoli]|uniref:Ig-like domain-containing protein n=1 Tax=Flavobacterium alkalisoli TaxID=2602769 RepID=UPI003A8E53EF
MYRNRFLLYITITLFISLLSLNSCAKRGTITGGPKDSIPPVLVYSTPDNMSTEFKGNEIQINFSEYIKVKDISKQLIISPPMKNTPTIYPMGSASKYIRIKIKDTLEDNTTYSFNFGQSITDNNEGNPYSQFKFVFSTGTYIDSLTLGGKIKDAFEKKPDNFVTVMLYEANDTYNDSIVYKEKPRYITNTLDSMVNYKLENLKEGKYYVVALKDKNNNYKFDPASDKIAFLNKPITVPNDSLYELNLFMEKKPFKALKPVQASSNRYFAGYEGDGRDVTIEVKNAATKELIKTITSKVPEKDSLQIWTPRDINSVADSLLVSIRKNDSLREFVVKTKEMKAADSLGVDAVQKGTLHFRDKFAIFASTPLVKIDTTKIALINKDSVAVPYTTKYDELKQQLEFEFKKEEEQKYNFTLLPGALKDFYEKENDTLSYTVTTKLYSNYGNLRISLRNTNRFPLILEIFNTKDKVIGTAYIENESQAREIAFDAIAADKYSVRVIYDDNGNREWDSGNYLEKRQPEEVFYYLEGIKPKEIDIRENWDAIETITLP